MDYDDIRIMALSLAKVGLGNPLPKEVFTIHTENKERKEE